MKIAKFKYANIVFILFTPFPDYLGFVIFSAYPRRGFSDEVVLED